MANETSPACVNPILWEDLPDMEVIRVDDVYYMSASSFHFSPGAPLLRSYNLVDWEYVGHSVPDLATFSPKFRLDGKNALGYIKGVWASTLKYRKSNSLFYWYGAIQGTNETFIYTAKNPGGPWTAHPPIEHYYYDCGVLIDEDDSFYMAYGTKTIHVAKLSSDGLKQVSTQVSSSFSYPEETVADLDGPSPCMSRSIFSKVLECTTSRTNTTSG